MLETIYVDSFAGGGGASTGMEWGLGRPPDVAINHDAEAIAMHAANHPETEHLIKNVWRVDPLDATRGREVRLAWFSPDCKHFSKAKGGKPVEKRIRDLAWVVVLWAERVKPDIIMLENVEEFADWGPLLETGLPCPDRKGQTFELWKRKLRRAGYTRMEARQLRGCDYGAPTIRKRLFFIARRDGKPIVWPEPTHGPGLLPYRTAAEIIDWSLPCPSIFLSREEGRAIGVNRPLADATMARIAKGVFRYVINAAQPFIVPITHAGDTRVHSLDEPLRTVTTAHRGEHALVTPYLAGCGGRAAQSPPKTADAPLNTATAKADQILCTPYLVPRYGERPGQEPRTHSIEQPMPTIVPTANGGTFVAAFLAQHNTDMVGHDAREPVSTIVQKGCTQAIVAAHMLSLKGSDRRMSGADAPTATQTAGGWHIAEVRAFLLKYYGTAGGQSLGDPAHTIRTRDNLALVMVKGEPYEIVDIGMRMLTPRELFRAQGFPDSYIIDPIVNGKPLTKTAQIRMCGNSVCPPVVAALTRANIGAATEAEAA